MKKIENTQKNEAYFRYVCRKDPKSKIIKTVLIAFSVGGAICVFGEVLKEVITAALPTFSEENIGSIVTAILIFIGALLTGIGVYDDIGKVAGAGSVVPITGFANSVVSPAIEFKTEGYVYGMESKMFVVAGPVIVSGIVSSVLVGLIYYVISLF